MPRLVPTQHCLQHYDQHRPHRALSLRAPDPPAELAVAGKDVAAAQLTNGRCTHRISTH
ncbi:MAG TPA: hypothetical protein VGR74_04465 [Actinomycetota bacterium]|nr:hypothetical protein [Actinomycetota bacterium]